MFFYQEHDFSLVGKFRYLFNYGLISDRMAKSTAVLNVELSFSVLSRLATAKSRVQMRL